MPRPKKKTPLTPAPDSTIPEIDTLITEPEPKTSSSKAKSPRHPPYLSVEEKRKWLAAIVRDTSGQHQGFEIGMGDKFKALIEDNKLAGHPSSQEEETKPQDSNATLPDLLRSLLETVTPPQQQRFSSSHE